MFYDKIILAINQFEMVKIIHFELGSRTKFILQVIIDIIMFS